MQPDHSIPNVKTARSYQELLSSCGQYTEEKPTVKKGAQNLRTASKTLKKNRLIERKNTEGVYATYVAVLGSEVDVNPSPQDMGYHGGARSSS